MNGISGTDLPLHNAQEMETCDRNHAEKPVKKDAETTKPNHFLFSISRAARGNTVVYTSMCSIRPNMEVLSVVNHEPPLENN